MSPAVQGGAILASVVLLAAAIKSLPTIWHFIHTAARVPSILEGVAAEFAPNGGGSLKDSIDRLAEATKTLEHSFRSHLEVDEAFQGYTHQRFHDVLNEQGLLLGLLAMSPELRERTIHEIQTRRAVASDRPSTKGTSVDH